MIINITPESQCNFPKPYRKPILEELGDLRDITLGGSVGCGESGCSEYSFRNGPPSPKPGLGLHTSKLPNLLDLQMTQQPKKK
jgi:hypothetical protein